MERKGFEDWFCVALAWSPEHANNVIDKLELAVLPSIPRENNRGRQGQIHDAVRARVIEFIRKQVPTWEPPADHFVVREEDPPPEPALPSPSPPTEVLKRAGSMSEDEWDKICSSYLAQGQKFPVLLSAASQRLAERLHRSATNTQWNLEKYITRYPTAYAIAREGRARKYIIRVTKK